MKLRVDRSFPKVGAAEESRFVSIYSIGDLRWGGTKQTGPNGAINPAKLDQKERNPHSTAF